MRKLTTEQHYQVWSDTACVLANSSKSNHKKSQRDGKKTNPDSINDCQRMWFFFFSGQHPHSLSKNDFTESQTFHNWSIAWLIMCEFQKAVNSVSHSRVFTELFILVAGFWEFQWLLKSSWDLLCRISQDSSLKHKEESCEWQPQASALSVIKSINHRLGATRVYGAITETERRLTRRKTYSIGDRIQSGSYRKCSLPYLNLTTSQTTCYNITTTE